MDEPLFPGFDPPADPRGKDLSAGRRLTLRQQALIDAGRHPLTRGPIHPEAEAGRTRDSGRTDPFTCGSCEHRWILAGGANNYPKCVAEDGRRVSHAQTTDVRAWWPACPLYSPAEQENPTR